MIRGVKFPFDEHGQRTAVTIDPRQGRGFWEDILDVATGKSREREPSGSKKLKGADELWRIRVGDYRIIHAVNDTESMVEIRVIRHRGDAYRPT